MSGIPKFHISFPESKAVEVLRIRIDELEQENRKLRAQRDWLREFARGTVKGKGARLHIMNRAEAILKDLEK